MWGQRTFSSSKTDLCDASEHLNFQRGYKRPKYAALDTVFVLLVLFQYCHHGYPSLLAHDVSGSGSRVARLEFVVAQKTDKMKSLCFSRQLLTPPAGRRLHNPGLNGGENHVLLLLIDVSIEIKNIASVHLLDKD